MKLPLQFTVTFVASYEALPDEDLPSVDAMLDRLETRHDQPEIRSMIVIGEHSLFATPRIHGGRHLYRVTWRYDARREPSVIVCITVASIET